MSFSHSELCEIALKWLKRPISRRTHGCSIALTDCQAGNGERPDAIGFRADRGSVVIEVKVSRADFLADKNKPYRQTGAGIGNWRYYMAPEGLISVDELPDKWGLLEINKRGHVKIKAGFVKDGSKHFRFDDVNIADEWYMLVRVMSNTDPQKYLDLMREKNKMHRNALHGIKRIALALGLSKNSGWHEVEEMAGLIKQRLERAEQEKTINNDTVITPRQERALMRKILKKQQF